MYVTLFTGGTDQLGSISSRFGSAVVYPPPDYGWITGPWRLSVTSHPVFFYQFWLKRHPIMNSLDLPVSFKTTCFIFIFSK